SPLGHANLINNRLYSLDGNWFAGLMGLLIMLLLFYVQIRRVERKEPTSIAEKTLVHPVELLPKMLLYCAVFGFIGAKFFNVFEDGSLQHEHGHWQIAEFSGFTFYGGLIFGAAAYFYIGLRHKLAWRTLADIGSLGMLVAYCVGRLGCHFSGDGDWGIVNKFPKPFSWIPENLWAFDFPHNVIQKGVPIAGCTATYCQVLPEAVFPTSAYEAIVTACF